MLMHALMVRRTKAEVQSQLPPKVRGESRTARCYSCPAGTHAKTEWATACSICPAGKFSQAGAEDCTDCDAGRTNFVEGSDSCETCPAGKTSGISNVTNTTVCVDCAAGKASQAGAAECTDCHCSSYRMTEMPLTSPTAILPNGFPIMVARDGLRHTRLKASTHSNEM